MQQFMPGNHGSAVLHMTTKENTLLKSCSVATVPSNSRPKAAGVTSRDSLSDGVHLKKNSGRTSLPFINYFKLRASYGKMGMDPGDPFQYMNKFGLSSRNGIRNRYLN